MLSWKDAKKHVPLKFQNRHPNSWWHLYQGYEGTCAPSSVAMVLYNMGYAMSSWLSQSLLTSEVRRASKWSIWNKSKKKAMRTGKEWSGKYPGMYDPEIGHLLESYGLKIKSYTTTVGGAATVDALVKVINAMPVDHAGVVTHDDHAMCVIQRSYGTMVFDPAQKVDEGGATWLAHSGAIVSKKPDGGLAYKACLTKNKYNKDYPVESFFLIDNSYAVAAMGRSLFTSVTSSYQYATWWFHKK